MGSQRKVKKMNTSCQKPKLHESLQSARCELKPIRKYHRRVTSRLSRSLLRPILSVTSRRAVRWKFTSMGWKTCTFAASHSRQSEHEESVSENGPDIATWLTLRLPEFQEQVKVVLITVYSCVNFCRLVFVERINCFLAV